MNFAGALEKNAGKECTVRSLCREMKSSAGLRLDPARRKGRLPKKGERLFAEKRRKAICRKKISWSGMCFYLSGEDHRFYKRRVKQYPASLSGGLQSPTEINAQLHNAPQEHCYACIGTRGCAGIRFGRCQLALTRIPRQFSRARIELSGYKLQTFRGKVVYTSTR